MGFSFSCDWAGAYTSCWAPQTPQKREPALTWAPQLGQ